MNLTVNPRPISRREFGAATGVFAGMALLADAAEKPKPGIIDAHVHVWTPDLEKYPLGKGFTRADMQPPSFTPEQLFAHSKPHGVDRIVLIQMSYYRYDNSYMLDMMAKYPEVFRGVAVIDPEDKPAETMKMLKKKGVRGFRIRDGEDGPEKWVGNAPMEAMWRCGADEKLAMCGLINPPFLPEVDRMCAKFPQTPVVIDHFGRVGMRAGINQRDLDNLCRLARHENVHVKVSAFYALGQKKPPYRDLIPMIKKVRDAFGAERLMWASDSPFQVVDGHTYAASIQLITQADFLKPDEKEALLRGTAKRVLFS